MSRNLKISLGIVLVAVIALVVIVLASRDDSVDAPDSAAARDQLLVRPDSPRLSDGKNATFVEFLDFECEACGALYPTITQLKADYGDRVAFVVRYMPLHVSSVNAARAAEAAGAQGKYQEMYDLLFQGQAQWGHSSSAVEEPFFAMAEQLGLDMEQFRADYDDPAVLARIQQSEADGKALGVQSTPTLFMNGERIEPTSLAELIAIFDDAAGG